MNQELNDTSIFFSESEDDIGDSRVGVRSVLRYREQSRLELHKRLKSCPVAQRATVQIYVLKAREEGVGSLW
jgi:hypothetical protein